MVTKTVVCTPIFYGPFTLRTVRLPCARADHHENGRLKTEKKENRPGATRDASMSGGADGGRRRRRRRSSGSGSDRLDELDVTREELDGIGAALRDERFRKLLCEYVDEVADPENRARQEREMEQYERERGVHVTFVRPRPGFVVKTSGDGARKVFVNVCGGDAVAEPTARPDAGGHHWSLPHCLSPRRRDYDRARRPCDVYDVVFHPRVLQLAAADPRFRHMVEDTALTMVETTDGVALDRANLKYPKTPYKGVARSLAVRRSIDGFSPAAGAAVDDPPLPGCPPYELPVDRPVRHHDLGAPKPKCPYAVPAYAIKYRSDVDIQEHGYGMHCKMNAVIPKELIVEIKLPLLDSTANVALDVLPRSLKLVCDKPSKYRLEVDLPYTVLEDEGNATFNKSTRTLTVRLPVLRTEPPLGQRVDRRLVSKVDSPTDVKCVDVYNNTECCEDSVLCNGSSNVDRQENKTTNGYGVSTTDGHHDENMNKCEDDTISISTNGGNITENDDSVHYVLPEHEFIFGNKCILTLKVKNVDPTSINVIVDNETNLISGKLQSIGSGYFPVWFAFCFQIPSKTTLLTSDVKVIPSDTDVIVEFFVNLKMQCEQYLYGLEQDSLKIQCIKVKTLKENSISLANSILGSVNDSDDDCDDDDVFDNSKEKIELKDRQHNSKNNYTNLQCKDNNGKITKEKGKKKKRKKIQKSSTLPIVVAESLPGSNKNVDFVPGSLPTEFNNTKPIIRGILKKRSLSECSNVDDLVLSPRLNSSSVDNVDTGSSDLQELSFNDCKKTVRFNDHVIEKKINFNISIAAQAKKHRQRQQRKRNIREYNTPSESEASEAEDRVFGPLNVVSESEETSVSESSAGEMSDDNSSESTNVSSKVTVVADSKKDHKRRKSKSARKNASLAKQASTSNLIFSIDY